MMRSSLGIGALCLALAACAGGEVQEASSVSFGGLSGGGASETDAGGEDTGGGEATEGEGGESMSASGGPGGDTDTGGEGTTDTTEGSGSDDDPGCRPEPEVCDGVDNDCDGSIDGDTVDSGEACDTGMPGVCSAGVTVCESGELVCEPDVTPSAEVCDGVDNDCNGQVDDGDPEGGVACDTGLSGVCSAGTTACQDGTLDCIADQQPSAEVCDGVDNDCNGQVDDGNPGGGGACNTGLPGVCAAGTTTCQGGSLQCAQNQQAGTEICGDGVDNDCDGQVDEGCGCSHPICQTGVALVNGCDPCVTQICAVDPFCCNTNWDSLCVQRVSSECGQVCQGTCSHSPCVTGVALVSGCDPGGCVSQVCTADPYCCNNNWDSICVGEVSSVCGLNC